MFFKKNYGACDNVYNVLYDSFLSMEEAYKVVENFMMKHNR